MCCDLYIDNWKKYMDETRPGWNSSYMDEEDFCLDEDDDYVIQEDMNGWVESDYYEL